MSGGNATNAGIEYQQRVAAWCLINQYSTFDISVYFPLDNIFLIKKVFFETDSPIDDLTLESENNIKLFLQIKRSISLSTNAESEFVKTITQFVEEFSKNESTPNFWALITSSNASGKITNDLKKISDALRINIDAFSDNPLNESEKDTLQKVKTACATAYYTTNKKVLDDTTFIKFFKKLIIVVLDIETGYPIEIASIILLRSLRFDNPELIWSILIKNSLYYATNRMSISKDTLINTFNKYLSKESQGVLYGDSLKTNIISQGQLSVGLEVLLINSVVKEHDFMIMETFRFKEDCQFKSIFFNNTAKVSSGQEWSVVQRFASLVGAMRYLEDNEATFKGKKIAVIKSNKDFEDTECSILHRKKLEKLIDDNEDILLCLHCGKTVAGQALLVEVQDQETSDACGMVHKECARQIDRILGICEIPVNDKTEILLNFDFKRWVNLMIKGQGLLNALRSNPQMLQGQIATIAWKSDAEFGSDYTFCIKFNLEDNSSSYAYTRGKIERVNKSKAETHIKLFNEIYEKGQKDNDPYSILTISKTCAPYSELVRIKNNEEMILEIKSAEIVRYSKLIAKVFDNDISYYSPLCVIRDRDTEMIINLGNIIPIISDPLNLKMILKNWENLGVKLYDFELKIIESDSEFDSYMRMIFSDGMTPIIDPEFDKNAKLVKGYPVNIYNAILATKTRSK
jgi:hypothetical protein